MPTDREPQLIAQALRKRTAEVDRKLARLRVQTLFLFALIVVAMLVMAIYFQHQAQQIELDRYIACVQRQGDIDRYNEALPTGVPLYPVPTCPPDPRL